MDQPILFTELSLDLQIHICKFLHPLQILALRQTCKVFKQVTSHRIIWINALIRICHENMLFLPSFPIPDMSVAKLERAATAPFRWISLSSSNDGIPSRSTARVRFNCPIASMVDGPQFLEYSDYEDDDEDDEEDEAMCEQLYLVPGGRYLAVRGPKFLSLLDLEYTSSDGRRAALWSTTVERTLGFVIHRTPDGLGIRILIHSLDGALTVFEIYPEKENPKLVQIARIFLGSFIFEDYLDCFLHGDRAVVYSHKSQVVIVWDFIANTIASWSVSSLSGLRKTLIRVTETAIVIINTFISPTMSIFLIPPLITTTLFDIGRDTPELAPIFAFKYPETEHALLYAQRPDCWYSGELSSFPFYINVFETIRSNDRLDRLELSSDLSHFSRTTIAHASHYFESYQSYHQMIPYRICQDSSVYVFYRDGDWEATTVGSASSESSQTRTTCVNTTLLANIPAPSGFCPASARLVYTSGSKYFIISDFL